MFFKFFQVLVLGLLAVVLCRVGKITRSVDDQSFPFLHVLQVELGPREILKAVSGTYVSLYNGQTVIESLKFVTNEGTYGPYGRTTGTPFNADVPKDQSIVGFFGRADDTQLIAFGVYTV